MGTAEARLKAALFTNANPSPLRRIDARTKLAALLIFLIPLSTTVSWRAYLLYALCLFAAAIFSRLPLPKLLLRAAAVLPFSAALTLFVWWSRGPAAALPLLAKSYLSTLAVAIVMAATPLPEMARALEWAKVPSILVLVLQFLYRYLWVTAVQTQAMTLAARSRAGKTSSPRAQFRAAAGSLGVLFARSSERAEGIYQAMLARGFNGRFPALALQRFQLRDAAFLLLAGITPLAIRFCA